MLPNIDTQYYLPLDVSRRLSGMPIPGKDCNKARYFLRFTSTKIYRLLSIKNAYLQHSFQ